MAEHYSVAIFPARVKRPKDKASGEQAVQRVTRWILARLRSRILFDLVSLNQAIRLLLDDINRRPFKGSQSGSGQVLFLGKEKAALSPLPSTRYEVACWKKAKAPIDYHVEIDSHL